MHRFIRSFLTALLISSSAALTFAADSIYWDRDTPTPDPVISDKDFKLQYGSKSTKSWGDREIYNTPSTKDTYEKVFEVFPWEDKLPPLPGARETGASPDAAVNLTPQNARPPMGSQPSGPAVERSIRPPAPEQVQSRPATGATTQSRDEDVRLPATGADVSGRPADVKKNIKWGQSEDKPQAIPESQQAEKPKYQWGR